MPKGGPDGGNGGRGGHIILKGNAQLWTLLHLRYRKHVIADSGQNGSGSREFRGQMGQMSYWKCHWALLPEMQKPTRFCSRLMSMMKRKFWHLEDVGGLGNENFKTSTKQTPRYAQPGEDGIEGWFVLELKLLADVGLVGFPNAGKSTLLSVVSAAKPEIADYAFTTLVPNLGVVEYRDHKSFVMADIPGIIEGAAEGKGLGIRFLRHIERNSILLFLIPADADNIEKEYEILLNELRKYNPELLDKQRILAISKSDMLDDEMKEEMQRLIPQRYTKPLHLSNC